MITVKELNSYYYLNFPPSQFFAFSVLSTTSLSQKSAQKKDARRRPHEFSLFAENCFIVFTEFLNSLVS